jgi:uncharacterized protein (TIRG00374 family)
MTKKHTKILLGLGISVLFVTLAVQSMETEGVTGADVAARLGEANLLWVAAYGGTLLLMHGIRLFRWGLLLRSIGPVSWRKIVGVGAVGQAAILLFPVRLGEAVRPLLIVDKDHVNLAESTATIVIERVIDGLFVGLFFIVTLLFLDTSTIPRGFELGAQLTTLVFGGAALFLIFSALFRNTARRLIEVILNPFAPKFGATLGRAMDEFLSAILVLTKQRWRGLVYLSVTLILWLVTMLSALPIFAACDLDLPVIAAFAVMCSLVIGFMVPAGPAATGPMHWAVIMSLGAFGVEASTTGAVSILFYVVLVGVSLFVGLVGLILRATERNHAAALPGSTT